LSLATSMPTTTRSFCAIIHSLPLRANDHETSESEEFSLGA
jgi:hypothetical protein